MFENSNNTKPKVLIANWPGYSGNNWLKNKKLFILPFEKGFQLKDAPPDFVGKQNLLVDYFGEFDLFNPDSVDVETTNNIQLKPRYTKEEYIQKVIQLKKEISLGNIYEINFCFDFYAQNVTINPYRLFKNLNDIANAPYAALVQINEHYILLASPECFLTRNKNIITAKPMKGTRALTGNVIKDEAICIELKNNLKEQNENVMIVDLVRNDLSRIANKNTVKVNELFGVYSYNNVAQMISSIQCEVKNELKLDEILFNNFPMGSMTGAPKPKCLELINQLETTPRGYYSGTIGFMDEQQNFDSCVVIRSIFYDSYNKYLSFYVGSAITALCNPEEEYEECLIKAGNMLKAVYGE